MITPSPIEMPSNQGAAWREPRTIADALRLGQRANAGWPVPMGSREKPTLPLHQDDPISRHIASAEGDLLSWLRPENVVLTGPRLSESEGIEGWIDALVTRWEKQHGPIPKKEVMPHEIAAGVSCLGTRTEQSRNV